MSTEQRWPGKLRKLKPTPAAVLAATGQLLCLAALVMVVLWSAGGGQQRAAAAARGSAIGLSVTAPQAVKAGDPLTLTLTVTNQTGGPCALSTQAPGTVALTVQRDGVRQFPDIGGTESVQPLSALISHSSHVVPPGGTVTVSLASTELPDGVQALESVSASAGYTVAAHWPLNQPGRYTIGVTYAMPGGKGTCAGVSGTALVTVTVTKCAQHSAVALWLPRTLGGLGALATAAALVLALGARRRGFARAVATACVILLGVATPGLASALIVTPKTDRDLNGVASTCLSIISVHDPAGIYRDLVVSTDYINILRAYGHEDKSYPIHRDGKLEAVVKWNPEEDGLLEDTAIVPVYPCAELYHELVHAFDILTHRDDATPCHGDGDEYAEIRATWAENAFRSQTTGDKSLRTQYTEKLPDPPKDGNLSYDAVRQACGDPAHGKGAGDGHHRLQPKPGGSNGDPHLTTFDGARYDFQTVGEFTLARADGVGSGVGSGVGGFEVQARQAPLFDSRLASVNSAVGLRVGSDRLSFSQEDSLRIRLDGADTAFGSARTKLPGGGTVSVDDDGWYIVTWPDTTEVDILPIGAWGLQVEVYPSPALHGKTRGLLGDDDANPENDLVTSAGATLPTPPDAGRLYGAFADGWRVTDATSLLPYPAGTNTATFTDRTFPAKPATVADLDPGRRGAAEAVCRELGIVDSESFADCVVDVALSGQPAFATGAGAADDQIGPATRPPAPPVVVKPGGALHDGDVAEGAVSTGGQVDTYRLDVGSAPAVYLVDVQHLKGNSDRPTLTLVVDGPDASNAPAFIYTTTYLFPLVQGGAYTLHVSRTDGDTGPYSFRLVTAKEKRMPLALGQATNGNLEQPGRADIYSFVAPTTGHLYLRDGIGCDLSAGVADDAPRVRVFTPYPVCWDDAVASVEAGKRYDLVIWSFDVKEGPYSFTAVVK
ncbi:MAG: VWD domain-containing protein [Catenulispora sp.]|nr:VWD domain-containing protein [Catenulispora sp.]